MTPNVAVFGDQAYPFEYGPGTAAYLPYDAADPAFEGRPVVEPPDGRTVAEVPLSALESVFSLQVLQLVDEPRGKPTDPVLDRIRPDVIDVPDPRTGYLAPEAGTKLVQVRQVPDLARPRTPRFPSSLPGDSQVPCRAKAIQEAAYAAITALAPAGWTSFTIECTAMTQRMELVCTVTFADGEVRSWAPPAMVGQWLHRMRVRDYTTVLGTWFTRRMTFTPDAPVETQDDDPRNALVWPLQPVGPNPHINTQAIVDELRLLPRVPVHTYPWMVIEAIEQDARVQDSVRHRPSGGWLLPRDPGGQTEIVRLFDGTDAAGKPAWYRPKIGRDERAAVLNYLERAPLVLWSRGLTDDVLAERNEPSVPLGFHTDGRWVWPSAAAYYLREHDIPPVLDLVDHIRQNDYRVPDEIPQIAMSRADSLAKGMPWEESIVDSAFDAAMSPVYDTIARCQTSPRFYSIGKHKDISWCLVRDGDWYVVYWADAEGLVHSRMPFGDVKNAAAYLIGQLESGKGDLGWGADEEIPWWQSPTMMLSPADPPLSDYPTVMSTQVSDIVVSRHGAPDGNMVFADGTPFEQRGLPAKHADLPHHRYLLKGDWWLMTALTAAGGRMYLLPWSIADHMHAGFLQEIVEPPAMPADQPAQPAPQAPASPPAPQAPLAQQAGPPVPQAGQPVAPPTPAVQPSGPPAPRANPQLPAGHPGLPPITDEARAEASRNPGGWLWCADPDVHPGYFDDAPFFTMLGAYKVDDAGNLTGESFVNDDYVPGPTRRNLPQAHSEFEFVLNYIVSGWLPQERLLRTILDNDVMVELDGAGGLRVGVHQNGTRFLVVWSSPQVAPANGQGLRPVPGRSLLPVLRGTTLVVNPGGVMGIELSGDVLIAAAG